MRTKFPYTSINAPKLAEVAVSQALAYLLHHDRSQGNIGKTISEEARYHLLDRLAMDKMRQNGDM